MRIQLFTVFLALPLWVCAQQLEASGATLEELLPEGWTHDEARGDLNKDGMADLAIIAVPNDAEHMVTREDGYVSNHNQPILAIYMGQAGHSYRLWKQYADILPATDEFTIVDHSLTITDRGTLQVSVSKFFTAGGWESPSATYVLRFQDGDFFLIGKETDSYARNSGEGEKVSENYLTRKQQRIIYNAMDNKVKPREKWSKLPYKKLERLGTFEMDAY